MKRVLSILMIVMLLIFSIRIYALDKTDDVGQIENEENTFFSVSSEEISAGSTLELIFSLDKIEYDNFTIQISSSDNVLDNLETSEDIEIEEDDENNFLITVKKSEFDISELVLKYTIPDNLAIGTVIKFNAKVIDIEDENNFLEEETEVKIKLETPTVDETKNIENLGGQEGGGNSSKGMEGSSIMGESGDGTGDTRSNTGTSSSNQMSSNSTGKDSVTVEYNGDWNNYLSNLYVDGYEFSNSFSKENLTYFIDITEDVDELNIVAEAENEESTICISGNSNISEGSKILINVTAENGNVRTYRIFVI